MTFGSVDVGDVGEGVVATLLYFVVGAGVLALGFLVLDLLTPGNLRRQVYVDRRPNATVLLAANHLSLAIIVVTAILTSSDSLAQGLVDSAVYGLVGIALQALALRVLDGVVPGHLRAVVDEPTLSPAAWAIAASLVAIGGVTAAALS
ncbi:DUF350 domain-containing protein [Frankia sp. CNm7]|uniref:DUF350 domain-containing protein n=1 Tax=Frankia nepalensis TaxID=1836974 RepID=A0A937RHA5_9ACTN|nr:DUF350 domain-containing protein [Frankia nepalensis]MBL7501795.1 DUF350 domain-containing protein [Frankia nepalensis]MBL7513891.1 DUF350 domain-containing protein [Frankia nepalensis]MBL7523975.1 DUF350 domain-containing protein [Frankia nepalensis]MBL7626363.1 DUF350 domain-containing protein [Frankia nepalensis]